MTVTAISPRSGLIIPALGIVQILNWGSSYYLPAVLGRSIEADTGWSYGMVIGGLSLGLLVSGISAMGIGRTIERIGGRPVLSISSLLMAAGGVAMGLSPNLPCYFAAWVLIGLAMGAGLYDAAFSTLGRLYGMNARRAISTLTLWGGFASTVSWPLTGFLDAHLGWRATCLVYAAIQIFICLPLIRICIPEIALASPADAMQQASSDADDDVALEAGVQHPRLKFALLAAILTLGATTFGVIAVHLVTILQATGTSYAGAVAIGTVLGPSQVGSRVLERLFGSRVHPIWALLLSLTLMATGLLLLWSALSLPVIALVFYGAGAGIWSIARGTMPLALFGAKGYAELMGKLAAPTLIIQSIAPSLGALLMDQFGAHGSLAVLSISALVNLAGGIALWLVARSSVRAWAI